MCEPVHAASNATLNSTELNKFTTRTQNSYVRTANEQDYVKSEAVYIMRSHPFAPSPKTSILHSYTAHTTDQVPFCKIVWHQIYTTYIFLDPKSLLLHTTWSLLGRFSGASATLCPPKSPGLPKLPSRPTSVDAKNAA